MDHIKAAVEPLRKDAIQRSEDRTRLMLQTFAESLVGTNLKETAPFPSSMNNRKAYIAGKNRYDLARRVMNVEHPNGHRRADPDMAVSINNEAIDRMVKMAGEDASFSFDQYAAKLNEKVGTCDSAEICGSFLWDGSILTIKRGEEVERWKTQQILNFSGLGTAYNQWPTRKVK